MKVKNFRVTTSFKVLGVFLLISTFCFAGGMPWETPLTNIQSSLTGPVAKTISIISIAVCGLSMAFGEGGGIFGKATKIVLGISIALGASTLISSLF